MLKKNSPALYVILDAATLARRNFLSVSRSIISARPALVQLRDKQGEAAAILKTTLKLRDLCRANRVKFIINDRLDLVLLADCDGVHLGQGDIPVKLARKLLGRKKLIGVSCHSLSQALSAQRQGADYISIGPVFPTPTKPEYKPVGLQLVSQARKKIRIPFFAIGDVRLSNLTKILSAGARNIAVCREVCLAQDPAAAVKKIKSRLRIE
jgi:thiamine-phosphate pyrophosphorylase